MKSKTSLSISVILLLFLTCSLIGRQNIASTSDKIHDSAYGEGDVNSDGRIDIIDSLMVTQYYVGLTPPGFNSAVADVNDDGSITVVDALIISQNYVGLISSLGPLLTFSSTAGGPDKIWFESVTPQEIGNTFITDIYVNTGSQKCGAYGFEIEYNPLIVEIQSVTVGSEGFLAALDIDNIAGITRISGFDVTGEGPDSQLELITISWQAIGGGVTTINNTIDRLTDADYNAIGSPYTDDFLLLVGSLGDVNGDNSVNETDGLIIAQYSIGLNPNQFQPLLADVNEDLQINAIDSLLVYQYDLDIISDVGSPLPSSGGSTGQLWMDPIVDKFMGESGETLLRLNSSTQGYAAYKFDILYEPSILIVTNVVAGVNGNLTSFNITNSEGKTQIIGIDAYGSSKGDGLVLVNITWEIVGWGESDLNISVNCLVDNSTEQILTPTLISEHIIIPESSFPVITISSPTEYSCFNSPPTVNFDITSVYSLNKTWYSINAGENLTTTSESSLTADMTLWNALPEGIFMITIYANNSFGDISFVELSLVKDTIVPVIVINTPMQNEKILSSKPPTLNITLADSNLDTLHYTIIDGSPKYIPSIISGYNVFLISSSDWGALPNGDVTFKFTVNDTAGNEKTIILIVIKTDRINLVPGYNMPLIFVTLFIGALGTWIYQKKKK